MKETQDFTEGYCDGLVHRDPQPQSCRSKVDAWEYMGGYTLGTLDWFAMRECEIITQEAR